MFSIYETSSDTILLYCKKQECYRDDRFYLKKKKTPRNVN